MKKRFFTIFGLTVICAAAIIVVSSFDMLGGASVYAFSSGSPGGKTDSPLDGANCTQCHSGTLNAGTGTFTVTSNIPASGYVPGSTYTITCEVIGTTSTKIGFEVSAESASAKVGTYILTDALRTKSLTTTVTHTASGNAATSGGNGWQFNWIAPASGTGNVTFYGAFCVTDANGSSSGDMVNTATHSVIEDPTGVDEINVLSNVHLFPNPAFSKFQLSTAKDVEAIEIYNFAGQKVLEQTELLETVNVEGLSTGMYFVKLISEKGAKIEKLTIN